MQEEGKQTPPLDGARQGHIAKEHDLGPYFLNNKIKYENQNTQTFKQNLSLGLLSSPTIMPPFCSTSKDKLLKLLGNHCISIPLPLIQA